MSTLREQNLIFARYHAETPEDLSANLVRILARHAIAEAEQRDALLAACECDAALRKHSERLAQVSMDMKSWERMVRVLEGHGFIRGNTPGGFVDSLRDKALKLAKDT